jgi:hypothetical protein
MVLQSSGKKQYQSRHGFKKLRHERKFEGKCGAEGSYLWLLGHKTVWHMPFELPRNRRFVGLEVLQWKWCQACYRNLKVPDLSLSNLAANAGRTSNRMGTQSWRVCQAWGHLYEPRPFIHWSGDNVPTSRQKIEALTFFQQCLDRATVWRYWRK